MPGTSHVVGEPADREDVPAGVQGQPRPPATSRCPARTLRGQRLQLRIESAVISRLLAWITEEYPPAPPGPAAC